MFGDEIQSTSKPITMPLRSKTEYSLMNMRFDPAQNSPPSLWKMRLNQRIGGAVQSPIKRKHVKADH
jgi:hypothetical protein